ncbi:MerR family transcriptional regulator [Rhodococcus sp. NPDC003322]
MTKESSAREGRGVYGISVAAELSGVGPQALRLYERKGLLTPARTDGGTRRYSDEDINRLHRIAELIESGVNLAGIAQILHLESRNAELQTGSSWLRSTNARLKSDNSQLTSDNAQLTSDNAQLTSDNARLTSDNAQLTSDNAQLRQEQRNRR